MNAMLKSTDRPISQMYRLALLDLDGVVYRGKNPVEHAADSIRAAQRAGMQVEYTTNNSSRFQRVVAEQLRGFGLDVEPRQVITSSVVAARMVARHVPAGARILVLGAEHLREEVAGQGLTVVDYAEDTPEAVIQGWYPDMTWQQMAEVSYAVERGALYLVTNRDLTGWGPKLMGGLVALIVCGLVGGLFSLFGFGFGIMDLVLCAVGLLIFMGLTAYDTQMLKYYYSYFGGDAAMLHKSSIIGALNLYLDFINIFLYILRMLGRRSND